ncbi:hypothetical protein CR513_25278, partial [Mucuna pruriens]
MVFRHLQLRGNILVPTGGISAIQGETPDDKVIHRCILETEISSATRQLEAVTMDRLEQPGKY